MLNTVIVQDDSHWTLEVKVLMILAKAEQPCALKWLDETIDI